MLLPSFSRTRSAGFSLIELLLVLGIIAILLVAAFVVYPQVRDRNQANVEVTNLATMKKPGRFRPRGAERVASGSPVR